MIFEEVAKEIVEKVFGGIGVIIIGRDGIPLAMHLKEGAELDLETLGIEYSNLLAQIDQASQNIGTGKLVEFSLHTDQYLVVVRTITPDYFICLVMSPDGNFGKGRYLLRVNLPKLQAEF